MLYLWGSVHRTRYCANKRRRSHLHSHVSSVTGRDISPASGPTHNARGKRWVKRVGSIGIGVGSAALPAPNPTTFVQGGGVIGIARDDVTAVKEGATRAIGEVPSVTSVPTDGIRDMSGMRS